MCHLNAALYLFTSANGCSCMYLSKDIMRCESKSQDPHTTDNENQIHIIYTFFKSNTMHAWLLRKLIFPSAIGQNESINQSRGGEKWVEAMR